MNHEPTERIYREEKLKSCRRRKKQRTTKPRKPEETASGPGECLAMGFMYDNLADGRSIRISSLIDLLDRSCPILTVGFSQSGQGVINALNQVVEHGRITRTLRVDNGPEFTCKALQIRAEEKGVAINHTRPGKTTDNGHIESYNGRLREECLNQHIFTTLTEAQQKIEMWRQDYNEAMPDGAHGWLTPAAYREKKTSINS